MKLFQQMLVAGASLSLLAPVAAQASDIVNLEEINSYSRSKTKKSARLDSKTFINSVNENVVSLEAKQNIIEAGSFSDTTTASFSADFAIGAVDGKGVTSTKTDGTEAIQAIYGFQVDLNTSFTGEDSLDVSLDAGSNEASLGILDTNAGGTSADALTVDGISYTFPIGDKATVFFGDSVAGSSLYNTACVYGGVTVNLDDCGNGNSAMDSSMDGKVAAGASYDFGNGFTAAIGYEGQGSEDSKGLMTKEGTDSFGGQVTYTGDSYGLSVTYADVDATNDTSYTAFNAYYIPEDAGSLPSISAGYETGAVSGSNDTSQWMVGLQWDEIGAGTLGVSLGTDGAFADNATEYIVYEAFYSYPMNDGMTVTPIVFFRENADTDETGVIVKTSFSF